MRELSWDAFVLVAGVLALAAIFVVAIIAQAALGLDEWDDYP